jgi:hypothetical protein
MHFFHFILIHLILNIQLFSSSTVALVNLDSSRLVYGENFIKIIIQQQKIIHSYHSLHKKTSNTSPCSFFIIFLAISRYFSLFLVISIIFASYMLRKKLVRFYQKINGLNKQEKNRENVGEKAEKISKDPRKVQFLFFNERKLISHFSRIF